MKRKLLFLIIAILVVNSSNMFGKNVTYITIKKKQDDKDFKKFDYRDVMVENRYGEDGELKAVQLDCLWNGENSCVWPDGTGPNGGGMIYSGPPPVPISAEIFDDEGNVIDVNIESINSQILDLVNSGEDSGIVDVEGEVQFVFQYSYDEDAGTKTLRVTILTGADLIF